MEPVSTFLGTFIFFKGLILESLIEFIIIFQYYRLTPYSDRYAPHPSPQTRHCLRINMLVEISEKICLAAVDDFDFDRF